MDGYVKYDFKKNTTSVLETEGKKSDARHSAKDE